MTDRNTIPSRGLNIAQVCARLGGSKPLDRSTLWRRIRKDRDFPKPFYLWDSAPRFVEAEVDAYIARKIAERDDPACAAAQRERLQRREQRLKAARGGGAPPSGGDAAIKTPKQPSKQRADRVKRRKATPENLSVDRHRERQLGPDGPPRAKRRVIPETTDMK